MATNIKYDNLGLSPDQSSIYLALLNSGPQSAISLAKQTDIKRTYIYHLCKELEKENLVKLVQKGRTTLFVALSPDLLLTKAQEKKAQAESSLLTLESILPDLQSKYRLTDIKPVIKSFQGVAGIREMYKDIIKENDNILLFRSFVDSKDPEVLNTINEQLTNQVKAGIKTKTITPLVDSTKDTFQKFDKERLVERHITRNKNFLLPSQILVYGTKVAITSFEADTITTTIDNEAICRTFRQLFQLMWDLTEKEHQQITASW